LGARIETSGEVTSPARALVAQTENLPYADQTIDLDPNVRDTFAAAPRLTYDWRGRTSSHVSSSCYEAGKLAGRWRRTCAVTVSPGAPARIMRAHAHGSDSKASV